MAIAQNPRVGGIILIILSLITIVVSSFLRVYYPQFIFTPHPVFAIVLFCVGVIALFKKK